MDNKKQTPKPPSPRVLMLANDIQIIAGIYVTEGSDFIRLNEPYKIRIHESPVDDKSYFVDERMSLTPWMFQTVDKIYSLHKNHIMSIAVPNGTLVEYYDNVRKGLYPSLKKELAPITTKDSYSDKTFQDNLDEMSDEDYFETLEYLRGKIKAH